MHRMIILTLSLSLTTACNSGDERQRVVGELFSDRVELTAEFSEPITSINVAEGAAVTAGDTLIQLSDARARARLAESNAAWRQAQARLDELLRGPRSEQIAAARASSEGANQDAAFRQRELNRITSLHERGLASADALDKARAALDAALANRKLRRAQLQEQLAGTTVEQLAQAEQALAQAAARKDSAQIDLNRHSIKAPVSGVVDSRLFELGERPAPDQPVAVLLSGTQPHARVYVPEEQRVHVVPGTAARVYVDGLESVLDGNVRWIASEAAFTPYYALTERDRSRVSYVAKVDILSPRERLPDGIPVEVEFLIGQP